MTEASRAMDMPLTRRITVNWEVVLWVAIAALTIFTRLWALGDRAMSHDESLHTFYSWKLLAGEGYRHDPMMHGPLLYHTTFLSYFLFGASDFSARLLAAVTGFLLVLSPLLVRRWLGAVGAAATGIMLLISPVIMMYSRYIRHDIPVELFTVLMFVAFIRYLDDRSGRWIVVALGAGAGAITSAEMSYINGFILLTTVGVALLADKLPRWRALLSFALLGVGVGLLGFGLAGHQGMLGDISIDEEGLGLRELVQFAMLFSGLFLAWGTAAFMLSGTRSEDSPGVWKALRSAPLDAVLAAVAVFAVFYTLMFTTFFTNMEGINGFWRSITYWLEQHDVVRGGQPWYYYLMLGPMYEYLPLGLALAALFRYSRRVDQRFARGNESGDPLDPTPAAWVFVPMLVAWAIGVYWVYSWAGEKMPWLLSHLVVPMTFLAGRYVADVFEPLDLHAVRTKGWQLAGLVLLAAVILYALAVPQPLGVEQAAGGAGSLARWALAVAVIGAVLYAAWYFGSQIGLRQARLCLGLAVIAFALVLNTRDSVRANFVNDELATEYLVYAHGTPDDKLVFEMLLDMQERLGVDDPLKIGYDNEVSWPFTWYFRQGLWHEPPRYLDKAPSDVVSLTQLDAVLVGSPNYGKFEPYLRDGYVQIEYRRMWWPNEGYKGLTWERLAQTFTDPRLRSNVLNILFHRRYTTDPLADSPSEKPLTDWYHHANMKLFLKKDVVVRAWPLAQGRPDWLQEVVAAAPEAPPRIAPEIDDEFVAAVEGVGLQEPKDVAVAPDGSIYVVDHGNARIVHLDAEGDEIGELAAGDLRYADSGGGRQPSAWGVGVGGDGRLYVADTWNHRLLEFEGDRLVGSFGVSGVPDPAVADDFLDQLFGPRDVAVSPDGFIYLTDTGNKRIIVLDPDLQPVRALGGAGTAEGQFNEPTSLAFDPETGELYVADLWNLRIQVFDRDLIFVRSWEVDGWESQEAAHKAYLSVAPGGIVIASDPVGARVWFYSRDGEALGTLDLIDDQRGLDQPIGVDVDAQGNVYVVSSNSNVVTKYSAPEFILSELEGGVGAAEEESAEDEVDGAGEEVDEDSDEGSGEELDDEAVGDSPEATSDGSTGAAGTSTGARSGDDGTGSPGSAGEESGGAPGEEDEPSPSPTATAGESGG